MTITQTQIGLWAEPIHPTIGAVLHGVDARRLDAETTDFVRRSLIDHKVVFLRDQNLTLAEQEEFATHFGELWYHPVAENYPDFAWLSAQGGVRTRADNWHTDATFVEEPPFGSILQLLVVPAVGGDTLWADLEAAYGGLSEPVRVLVDDLVAVHDGSTFTPWADGPSLEPERRNELLALTTRRVEHPLVRVHPESGRRSLYAVTGFTRRIKGLSDEESQNLLALLYDHVTRPEYVVRYRWSPGDIAFWDNRNVLHRAADDYGSQERKLQRVTITEPVAG